ncbi:ATP-binding protein [Sphaerisporangium sp. TRM90804]|uniref:ATP-binding protein n=1 Tax=Sphaerisporangium sp. TRM90804 TaxID=3031113 RepID=UPI002447CE19|nr:ATP-binding protein [Sphaerisporangium sp. TRM90804]MDH2424702.1 ATP-binding protein [Sphaerisporangium sp. TRM90804]
MHPPLEACWDLPQDVAALSKVREIVHSTLHAWGLGGVADDIVIVVSELCANAMSYGQPPITLTLHLVDQHIDGEVTDGGAVFVPPQRSAPDDPSHLLVTLSERGRGLVMVSSLTTAWGFSPAPRGGKTVWFTSSLGRH